jgi:hypothetical protein
MIPGDLYHYYECSRGPFRNLSDLPTDEAEAILAAIRERREGFASQRNADYLTIRRGLEEWVRRLFIEKGGEPIRERPHYMIVGECAWLESWYQNGCAVHIPLTEFDPQQVSFTYGDTFPAMRYEDGKPYRKQVYTLSELPDVMHRYGMPQEWNADGNYGPDRYIEAQVWDDRPLEKWLPEIK